MAGKVYRMTQVVGMFDESVIDAIQGAVETASETVRNLNWFKVGGIRGRIDDGKVAECQVMPRVDFHYEN